MIEIHYFPKEHNLYAAVAHIYIYSAPNIETNLTKLFLIRKVAISDQTSVVYYFLNNIILTRSWAQPTHPRI
jgi:hypothetical protein